MKLFFGAVLLITVALFVLGPSFGFNMSPEKPLELFLNTVTAIVNFLAKVVEGLFS